MGKGKKNKNKKAAATSAAAAAPPTEAAAPPTEAAAPPTEAVVPSTPVDAPQQPSTSSVETVVSPTSDDGWNVAPTRTGKKGKNKFRPLTADMVPTAVTPKPVDTRLPRVVAQPPSQKQTSDERGSGDQQRQRQAPQEPTPSAWSKLPPREVQQSQQGPPPRQMQQTQQGPPPRQMQETPPAAKQPQLGAWGKPVPITKVQEPPPITKMQEPPKSAPQPSRGAVPRSDPTQQKGGDSTAIATFDRIQLPPIHIPNTYEVLVVPNRPGKDGYAVKVYTNHFPLITGKVKTIYQYDINITPMMSKGIQRIIMERARLENYPRHYPAYDGRKTLISPVMLFKEKEAEVICDFTRVVAISEDRNRSPLEEAIRKHSNSIMSKSYSISYKVVATLNIDNFGGFYGPKVGKEVKSENKSVIHALELVLRHSMSNTNIPVGRSIFYKPDKEILLGSMYCLYRGIFQSINLGSNRAYLNVDVANKGFPVAGSMVPIWEKYVVESNRKQITPIEKWLKGLRVLVTYKSSDGEVARMYKAVGFGKIPSKEFFLLQSGERMSVFDYFSKIKRVTLRRDNLPCLACTAGKNTVMIPMELCTIVPDQVVNKKMAADETRDMIASCATRSNERMANIMKNIQRANYAKDPVIKNFDLKVSDVPQLVNARILPAPLVICGPSDRDTERPSRGAWRQKRLKMTVTIREWSIIMVDTNCRDTDIQNFIQLFKTKCRQYGLSLMNQSPKVQRRENSAQQNLVDIFKYITTEDLVFVVIPDDNLVYSRVKTAAEIHKGILTQCIKQKTMGRMKEATLSNILLKVNAKLNGINHDIKPTYPLPQRTMFMGADVTHPSPESNDTPSVAAVTACHDKSSFKYNIRFQMQAPGRELITNLDELVKDHLMYYKEANGAFPQSIIFYRDGVSNGQFKDVLNYELTAIRKAYSALCKSQPSITFVVVQKRHHTRLFPSDLNSDNNVDVGTCVDTEITSPNCQNFFLVSHTSFQGVVKPTKYVTLWDDHKFSNDQLESITYSLCHMFSRCTRSVSYPAPTYYAHLAASRAKCYVHNTDFNTKDLYENPERYNVKLLEKIRKNLPMYFV